MLENRTGGGPGESCFLLALRCCKIEGGSEEVEVFLVLLELGHFIGCALVLALFLSLMDVLPQQLLSLQDRLYKILEHDLLVLIFVSLLKDLQCDIAIEQLPFLAIPHIPLIDAIQRPANLILINQ